MKLTSTQQAAVEWAGRFASTHMDRAGLVAILTGTGADHQIDGPLADRDPGMMRAELIGVAQARTTVLLRIIEDLTAELAGIRP